jgi:two-component system sensor histidine kinase DctS
LALRRIAEQAERAGKVIRSVHDFVRRRDQAARGRGAARAAGRIMPLVSLQARKLQVRVRVEVQDGCRPCCATAPWSSRCC